MSSTLPLEQLLHGLLLEADLLAFEQLTFIKLDRATKHIALIYFCRCYKIENLQHKEEFIIKVIDGQIKKGKLMECNLILIFVLSRNFTATVSDLRKMKDSSGRSWYALPLSFILNLLTYPSISNSKFQSRLSCLRIIGNSESSFSDLPLMISSCCSTQIFVTLFFSSCFIDMGISNSPSTTTYLVRLISLIIRLFQETI